MTKGSSLHYPVVLEQAAANWSGWVPDLPGCVATARTESEVLSELRLAMQFHLEGLIEDGQEIPMPFHDPITGLATTDIVTWVEIAMPHALA